MSNATSVIGMEAKDSVTPTQQGRIRLWPAVLLLGIQWLARIWATTGEPAPQKFFFGLVIAPVAALFFLLVWWLFASRLKWSDRLIGTVILVATTAATIVIAGKDFPVFSLILYSVPVLTTLWVVWLVLSMKLGRSVRLAGVLLIIVATGAISSMIRVEGMNGSFTAKFNWRWIPTAEAKLLSEMKTQPRSTEQPDSGLNLSLASHEGDWPGFRGPFRDGRLVGVRIPTDWEKSPPREVWRHRIGPGWSSCCVIGDRLFTQEQRGEDEFVVCYDARSGEEIWTHRDQTRFEEVVAGAGPRGTPTFDDGRIFAMGANGKLNCLDGLTGKLNWSADIVKDSKAKIPQWGFSSSPLVFHNLVSVFAGGPDGKSVLAYRIESGELAWASGEGSNSYCSTHAATFDGVDQILISTDVGLFAFKPENGTTLWHHPWKVDMARVVQPAIFNGTEVLLGTGMAGGTRRLSVNHESDKWSIKELWTTKAIKPYFNDLVISGDHLYGFDGNIFMCVGLNDGKMTWRARGYGNGQVLLIAEENLLLILSEQGDVALVEAQPEKHVERARFKAIEGKTWNHPVVAHGKIFVRNAEEIACFKLPEVADVAKSD